MDSEVMCNLKNLTQLLSNTGLRDASASKNALKTQKRIQFSPCHLKCSRDFVVFTNAFTGSPKQFYVFQHSYPSTMDEQSPSFTIFLLPIHKFRGAGLSEEQCLCVNCPVVNKIHKYEICVVLGCIFCVLRHVLF